jgi:sterol desaturase/sphingolipid hydroxylase (fatty acid hydroxylase superfamily)
MKWLNWQDYAYNLFASAVVAVFGLLLGESLVGAIFYGILVFCTITILQLRRAAAQAETPPSPVQKDERTEHITRTAGLYAFLAQSLLLAMALALLWAQPAQSPLAQRLAPLGAIMVSLIAGMVTFFGTKFVLAHQA